MTADVVIERRRPFIRCQCGQRSSSPASGTGRRSRSHRLLRDRPSHVEPSVPIYFATEPWAQFPAVAKMPSPTAVPSSLVTYTSVCSAISSASSTSIPQVPHCALEFLQLTAGACASSKFFFRALEISGALCATYGIRPVSCRIQSHSWTHSGHPGVLALRLIKGTRGLRNKGNRPIGIPPSDHLLHRLPLRRVISNLHWPLRCRCNTMARDETWSP